MKKIFVILFFIYSLNIFCDNYELKGGISYSKIKLKNYENTSYYDMGKVFGISKQFNLINNFYIQGELLFNQKKVYIEYNETKNNTSFNFIEFGLFLKYIFFDSVSIYSGFAADYLLFEYSGEISSNPQCQNDKVFITGINYYFDKFGIDFRYSKGLKILAKSGIEPNEMEHLQKSQQFLIMFGYKF